MENQIEKKNYLVHLSFNTYTFHSLIQLNEAQRLIDQGHNVTVLYCNNGVEYCYANDLGDKKICSMCKKLQTHWLDLLKGEFKKISYDELNITKNYNKCNELQFNYDGLQEIKNLTYKNVKIGYGALSTYISKTRNLHPAIDLEFRNYFDNLLKTECILVEILQKLTYENNYESIVFLNGRHFEVRPFYDFAKENNITVRCLEKGNSIENDEYRGFNYGEFLPHNLENINHLIYDTWNNSNLKLNEKNRIGSSFFEKRKNNIPAGDTVYTINQQKNLLPKNWDSKVRNFVIFNSSEDEFAAIGDEFDKLSFFENQIEGIKKIAEILSNYKNIHLYLRIHPNLIGIKYSYHTELYKLNELYPNLKVIPADDITSTYALIENAEKIIVFGSSTGIEAVNMEKPVILLAGSLYYYMNLCYIPKSIEELENLLINYLNPLDKNESLKYGFYILSNKGEIFDKIALKRTKYFPGTPQKINRETYFGMIKRFYLTNKIAKIESKNIKLIPTKERIND